MSTGVIITVVVLVVFVVLVILLGMIFYHNKQKQKELLESENYTYKFIDIPEETLRLYDQKNYNVDVQLYNKNMRKNYKKRDNNKLMIVVGNPGLDTSVIGKKGLQYNFVFNVDNVLQIDPDKILHYCDQYCEDICGITAYRVNQNPDLRPKIWISPISGKKYKGYVDSSGNFVALKSATKRNIDKVTPIATSLLKTCLTENKTVIYNGTYNTEEYCVKEIPRMLSKIPDMVFNIASQKYRFSYILPIITENKLLKIANERAINTGQYLLPDELIPEQELVKGYSDLPDARTLYYMMNDDKPVINTNYGKGLGRKRDRSLLIRDNTSENLDYAPGNWGELTNPSPTLPYYPKKSY